MGTSVARPSIWRFSSVPEKCASPLSQPSSGISVPSQGSSHSRASGFMTTPMSSRVMTSVNKRSPSSWRLLPSRSTSSPSRPTCVPFSVAIVTAPRNNPSGIRSSSQVRSERSPAPSVSRDAKNPQTSVSPQEPTLTSPLTSVLSKRNAPSRTRIPL